MLSNWQWNPQWQGIPVGFGIQTIGQVGCTVSVIGNILGKTPVEVNNRLKAVKGFSNGTPNGIGKGNLVVWAYIEKAFPGTKVTRVVGYNNDIAKKNVPNVICEVSALPIGGRGKHWVQYLGSQKCADPFTGKVRPTSYFGVPSGYAIIIPPPITQPIGEDVKDNKIRTVANSGEGSSHDRILKYQAILDE